MVIENKLKYEFKTSIQAAKWNKKYNTNYQKGDVIEVEFYLLKTKQDFRRKKLLCICDDCGKKFKKRLGTLAKNYNKNKEILCSSCWQKGEKHRLFGKKLAEETKQKISKKLSGENNPFYHKTHSIEVRKILKEKLKGNKNHLGFKSTPEQLKHISDGVKRGYADGSRVKSHGNAKRGYYKNILYQGSYELNFLHYLDNKGKLSLIERGPSIIYFDKNNEKHYYLSDYYIRKINLVIEIKSSHFWEFDKEINLLKESATKNAGYNYLLILDNNFLELDNIVNIL